MVVKRKITEPDGIYFITFTCFRWKPLIDIVDGYDLVYNWFDHLISKGHYIIGYVIMPNHIHALLAFSNTGQSINTIIGNGKRFIAYEIIKRLKLKNQTAILYHLNLAVSVIEQGRNKKHEVWEPSFDWKECRSNGFMSQKLDYIHNNPCKGKWKLAQAPVEYFHSSARFYIANMQSSYPVTSYLELADIDLTVRR